ncbi:hypothetical protein D9M71_635630 [compost metagenome]
MFVGQAIHQVGAGDQVLEGGGAGLVALGVVGVIGGLHVGAPERATGIVVIGHHPTPAVFVDVDHPSRVDVPLARLQGALEHPDPVEFVADVVGVRMAERGGDVGDLEGGVV